MEIRPEFRWLWRAWNALHDDRVHLVEGVATPMGATIIRSRPSRIPWTVICRWARYHRMTRAEQQLLHACIRAMDDVFLEDWQRRAGKPS